MASVAAHVSALKAVAKEYDDWNDFEQSEPSEEYFPDSIANDKDPATEPHPLWLAVCKKLQKFYPRNELPPEVICDWADLLKYSRRRGTEDHLTQRDKARAAGSRFRVWLTAELNRLETQQGPPSFNPQSGILVLDGQPLSMEANEHTVLQELVSRGAATLGELQATGVSAPHKILRRLVQKYPALRECLVFPGKKGRGGYSTTIRVAARSDTI